MVLKDGKPFMVIASPGEDVQTQAILEVLFNVIHFKMDVQTAVEVPRFRSLHGPAAQFPQELLPGQLRAEPRIPADTIKALEAMGHKIRTEPDWQEANGGVTAILRDEKTGALFAGADPRRSCYAIGW
jgi:gamma-glutamyltranspeptidase/glutathione hydrolase